jgi:tetratricopeptide (TPR) repeat protein
MLKQRSTLILLILGAIGLIVLFLMLPKQPASTLEKASVTTVTNADSLKLMQAVELVNGPNPMEGILLLRELVTKDSTNTDAQFYLGAFSVKSGQIDKAIKRFDTVISLRPNEVKYLVEIGYQYMQIDSTRKGLECFEKALAVDSTENNSLFFSAQAYERLGKLKEAKRNYESLLRHNTDEVVDSTVKTYINNIDKKLTQ